MNSALVLLNALVLVAVVSFQFQSDDKDAALVTVHAERMMPLPASQLAVLSAGPGARSTPVQADNRPLRQASDERFSF